MASFDELKLPLLQEAVSSPDGLQKMTLTQLKGVANEIRTLLCTLSEKRSVHFASNLGVVELAVALHSSLDFRKDRLVWDTGHQCYPHKLLTGRFNEFSSIRTLGGLMGYPNPNESEYDLFMTGHAGCSVGSALGLALGDTLIRPEEKRHAFAVIGDGALASGIVFEALNLAGGLKHPLTVILNDNKMSICKRVGGLGHYLDHLRLNPGYRRTKNAVRRCVDSIPSIGIGAGNLISRFKDAVKAGLNGGMLFEEFGFRYIGPVNGHDIKVLRHYLALARKFNEPVVLHVLTEKGHGYRDAELDPTRFHAPSPGIVEGPSTIQDGGEGSADAVATDTKTEKGKSWLGWRREKSSEHRTVAIPEVRSARSKQDVTKTKNGFSVSDLLPNDTDPNMPGSHSYTHWARNAIYRLMKTDPRFCVLTAAMTQGTMLEPIRKAFPERFFDVGICEANAVVTAAGLAKAGMRPVVDIYSTFLQRAYDHLFQEVSLQNLPVIFMIDRAGVVGADGPTHHGVFDLTYFRPFPNIRMLAPGYAAEIDLMLKFAAEQTYPCAIRYPRTIAPRIDRKPTPIEEGKAEVIRVKPTNDVGAGIGESGDDMEPEGAIAVIGGALQTAVETAERFAMMPNGERIHLEVINARFAKPIDAETILAPLRKGKFLVTVEEGMLAGGFGSAVLEAACDQGVDTRKLVRVGIPDRYVQHASRQELLEELGLDMPGLAAAVQKAAGRSVSTRKD